MRLTHPTKKNSSHCLPVFVLLSTLTQAQPVLFQQSIDKSWTVRQAGLTDKTTEKRAAAVRMLGLLDNDPKAPDLALKALGDRKPEVRAAAADALGQMKARSAAPKLAEVILSDEVVVTTVENGVKTTTCSYK